jgi:ribonuclease P/MRP protein subunit POP5
MGLIKPSMREKWRYVLFKIEIDGAVSDSEAKDAVEKGILRFIGEFGAAEAKPKLLEYDSKKMEGIVRCDHSGIEGVRAAMALIGNINGRKCAVRSLATSGTIAGLEG